MALGVNMHLMIKTTSWTKAFFLLIALASAPRATAEPNNYVMSGRYLLAATPSELAAREREIDLAVKEIFVLARPIARATLASKTQVASSVNVNQSGDKFTVEFKGRPPITGSLNVPSRWQSPEGEVFTVEFQLDDTAIVQILRGESGTRVNRFLLRADGVLGLEVEVKSPKLSRPLRYALTYRMQQQPRKKASDHKETVKDASP